MLFYSLFTIINNFLFLLLLNDYYKRTFPEQYESVLITFFLKMVNAYSRFKIASTKYSNKFIEYMNSNVNFKEVIDFINKKKLYKNIIYQITDDEIHVKYYINETEYYFENKENSIYILSDNENPINNCINNIIYHSRPFSNIYEVSDIKFIMLEVSIQDKSYNVNLKGDTYNYYVVGNILDKRFFLYFLRKYNLYTPSNIEGTGKNDKLVVKIIDGNADLKEYEITDTNFILIQKDIYSYCCK